MAYCGNCGAHIPDDSIFCPECGNMVQNMGSGNKSGDSSSYGQDPGYGSDGYNNGSNNSGKREYRGGTGYAGGQDYGGYYRGYASGGSMPTLADGEQVVKTYVAARLKRPRGTGYLTVTNKRVIFYGETRGSAIDKEVMIDSVSGMDCFAGTNYNIATIILSIIIGIMGIMFFVNGVGSRGSGITVVWGIILVALAAGLIYASIRRNCVVRIFSSKANGSPIEFGMGPTSFAGNRAVMLLVCDATEDTYNMMNELGALISDLQTMGDHAIPKWKQ